ncbi:MAG: ATP-dependent Clp protease ATP-binding subunit [Acidobacteriaceae bacterium]|nr:ATP-dependent Clp protease ATP-binding subunit [Acidobacteriaceae bacterium]
MSQLQIPLDPTRTGADATSLHHALHGMVVGQDEAVDQIVDVYQMHLAGMSDPGRPIANLLLLGPTGSGKTRTVEALAEALVNNPQAVIKIDCGEFQHSHEIAKLIGSPPGYLGHRETHAALNQRELDKYHTDNVQVSFVLFDEIEKASDALWNLLLGILDKGVLTLGDNSRVDFSRCMIFMTSNIGAAEMEAIATPKLGFDARLANVKSDKIDEKLTRKLAKTGEDAARRRFTPEFINRIDKLVVFKPLDEPELRRVLDIELTNVQKRILHSPLEKPFVFNVTDPAKSFLLAQGTDRRYGARHLKRAIERLLVRPLSNLIASDQVSSGDLIQVDFNEDARSLSFTRKAEGLGVTGMARILRKGIDISSMYSEAAAYFRQASIP